MKEKMGTAFKKKDFIVSNSKEEFYKKQIQTLKEENNRLKRQIQAENIKYAQLLNYFDDPVYITDLDNNFIAVNNAFNSLFKINNSLISENSSSLFHDSSLNSKCPACEARKKRQNAIIKLEAESLFNPLNIPLELIIKVIKDNKGKAAAFLTIAKDLTKEKENEEKLKTLDK
ncbi:MAG: PAS domain S-box protein, partial [Spirochaetia bacterium]|nr:PAS domain S-box protein [Spirochaetia bacterium]